jgi:Leucine-rich repeat (LRR) protein
MSEQALRLIEKEKKERTGKLNLGNCGLSLIPKEVFELTWLEELTFGNALNEKHHRNLDLDNADNFLIEVLPLDLRKLSNLRKFQFGGNEYVGGLKDCSVLGSLENLENLDLSSNHIKDISFLSNLTRLEFLNLDYNHIHDISTLSNLKGLQTLNLDDNQIKEFNSLSNLIELKSLSLSNVEISNISFLSNLIGLESLSLDSNQIYDISSLANLTRLDILDLNSNQISDISYLSNLTGLESLNLNSNPISDINYLSNLTGLESLRLNFNQISDISFLSNLTGLRSLDLDSNQISDISYVSNLTGLESLHLNSNQISDISFLSKLTGLKSLDLDSNQISDISFLSNLTKLEALHLDSNQISDISYLSNLTRLEFLDLDSNQISDISSLSNLTELMDLFLNSNQISVLNPLLPLLKRGMSIGFDWDSQIIIKDNPLRDIPARIVENGSETVINWIEQMVKGKEPLFESKLMILGQGEAGKTTFSRLLLDSNYIVKQGKEKSTLGISIHKGKEFKHTCVKNQNVKAHLWDFGGQDIQKMLHQFFITDNCLYVLVSDKRAENTKFDYWFQIINLLGPKSSVVVLENPKNIESANEDFAKNQYKELYKDLNIESLEVNLKETRTKDATKWKLLNETIEKELSKLEIVNRNIPKTWSLVRKELSKETDRKYISKDEFYAICSKPEIDLTHDHGDFCLTYLHELGDLVYFDDKELCTNIFLNHNWLTKGLYYILSDKSIQDNNGSFTRHQAYSQWNSHDYNEAEKAMLLQLLLKDKFDICYELPDEKDVFITPLLLPNDKPMEWEYETNLFFRYQYGFMPHGMFSRLIVRIHEKIDSRQRWKTGVRLVDSDNGTHIYAEVQQHNDPESNQNVIDIKIHGNKEGCKQLLSFIRKEIENLHKDFRNINVVEKIACNCDTCKALMLKGGAPSFHDYQKLKTKIKNRKYMVDCEKSNYQDVNIGQILSDVVIENACKENIDSELLHHLKNMNMTIAKIENNNNSINTNTTSTNVSPVINVSTTTESQAEASAKSQAEATATNTVSVEIQNILGETEMLKEDIERELKIKKVPEEEISLVKSDVEVFETALKEIENSKNNSQEPSTRSVKRVESFMEDLQDEESSFRKALGMLRKGKNYGVKLAKGYNKIATSVGLPPVPELILDVVDKI